MRGREMFALLKVFEIISCEREKRKRERGHVDNVAHMSIHGTHPRAYTETHTHTHTRNVPWSGTAAGFFFASLADSALSPFLRFTLALVQPFESVASFLDLLVCVCMCVCSRISVCRQRKPTCAEACGCHERPCAVWCMRQLQDFSRAFCEWDERRNANSTRKGNQRWRGTLEEEEKER